LTFAEEGSVFIQEKREVGFKRTGHWNTLDSMMHL